MKITRAFVLNTGLLTKQILFPTVLPSSLSKALHCTVSLLDESCTTVTLLYDSPGG
uniref:Uncharacterized protein n=1 Tax=Anguilla anguilla TaxID=7936 RepID=A0A0E9WAB3_ANGAN